MSLLLERPLEALVWLGSLSLLSSTVIMRVDFLILLLQTELQLFGVLLHVVYLIVQPNNYLLQRVVFLAGHPRVIDLFLLRVSERTFN